MRRPKETPPAKVKVQKKKKARIVGDPFDGCVHPIGVLTYMYNYSCEFCNKVNAVLQESDSIKESRFVWRNLTVEQQGARKGLIHSHTCKYCKRPNKVKII